MAKALMIAVDAVEYGAEFTTSGWDWQSAPSLPRCSQLGLLRADAMRRGRIERPEGSTSRKPDAYGSGLHALSREDLQTHVRVHLRSRHSGMHHHGARKNSRQATLDKALIHLQEHHDIEHPDAATLNAMSAAIAGIRI